MRIEIAFFSSPNLMECRKSIKKKITLITIYFNDDHQSQKQLKKPSILFFTCIDKISPLRDIDRSMESI